MKSRDQVDELRSATGRATYVRGHALDSEGAAYAETGVRNWYDSQGHGKCSCGERSPWLDSNAKRKAWHRQHKLDVLRATP